MISILLIEPRKQENVGAVARVIKNFGFVNLILVNPKCKIGVAAKKVAKHANSVLAKAKIMDFSGLKKFDCLVGTTAILGTDYNVVRSPLTPKELAQKLQKTDPKSKIGIVIGREGSGLTNKEIQQCDMLVTIPASKTYPTLNISHATALIVYELFQAMHKEKTHVSHIKPASKKDKEIIMKHFNSILNQVTFQTASKKETQKKVWKRVFGKAMLSRREAFAVMGFLRKLIK